jgi:phage tail sheath protein FI
LASQDAIVLGPKTPCFVLPEKNPADGLSLGKSRFQIEYARVPPAEHIVLEREIKQEYITQIFSEADFLGG